MAKFATMEALFSLTFIYFQAFSVSQIFKVHDLSWSNPPIHQNLPIAFQSKRIIHKVPLMFHSC